MKSKTQSNPCKNITRILIVDDHAIVRQALIKLIDSELDLMVCLEAENTNEALKAIANHEFDLAIVDISLENMNRLELTQKMKTRCQNLTIFILSMHDGLFYDQRALRAGVSGYVAKYEAAEKIITAIRQVLNGNIFVSNSKTVKNMHDTISIINNS